MPIPPPPPPEKPGAAAEVMDHWLKSESHRKNILDKRFSEIGIGIAPSEKGILYYAQVFGTPKGK